MVQSFYGICLIVNPFCMKNIFLLIMSITISKFLFAQIKVIDSNCNCSYQSKLKYPDVENGLGGTVLVEFEVDSVGFFFNAKVIQSIGKNFDNEALRVINE